MLQYSSKFHCRHLATMLLAGHRVIQCLKISLGQMLPESTLKWTLRAENGV